MSIRYDVYENPSKDGSNKKGMHVRAVNKGIITTYRLAREIETRTSLTSGDIIGALATLGDLFTEYLLEGERIHLKGIGYFKLTLKAPPAMTAKKLRAEYISVKGIQFIPEKSVKSRLTSAEFKRVKYKNRSAVLTKEEVNVMLHEYFKEHNYITRAEFQKLCSMTESTAFNRIRALVKEGKLQKGGAKSAPVYEPVK